MTTEKPFETAFTHTDGRQFKYIEDVPHTTRDGRKIHLRVWQTSCSQEGCDEPLTVKTATHTPQDWPAFAPSRFCPTHRVEARRQALLARTKAAQTPEAKAAQQAGLKRWLESPEYKEMVKNRLGNIEREIMEAVYDLMLVDDHAPTGTVLDIVTAKMEPPRAGKQDHRRERVMRSLHRLSFRKRLKVVNNGSAVIPAQSGTTLPPS